jgi:hypothetical protein
VQLKDLNGELSTSYSVLRTRVDALDMQKALVTRTATAAAGPNSSDDNVALVAGHIVEESMAEAAVLVHEMFEKKLADKQSGAPLEVKCGRDCEEGAGGGDDSGKVDVPLAGGLPVDSPRKLSLFVDDETLMHMSTKLTAMFIAIQRCGPLLHLFMCERTCFTLLALACFSMLSPDNYWACLGSQTESTLLMNQCGTP